MKLIKTEKFMNLVTLNFATPEKAAETITAFNNEHLAKKCANVEVSVSRTRRDTYKGENGEDIVTLETWAEVKTYEAVPANDSADDVDLDDVDDTDDEDDDIY